MVVHAAAIRPPVRYHPVVVRWITHEQEPLEQLVQQIPRRATYLLAGGGRFRLTEPFTSCDGCPVPAWSAAGRLYGTGPRLLRFSRVRIRISAWSATACELQLCPASRHIRRWAAGRHARYFALAHESADTLAGLLVRPGRPAAGG